MRVCGIISEFNPFHNGHKFLIDKVREHGYDSVICVMSGNFVQRGEYASFDKKIRAEAAIACGADLVLSIPFPWSSATAEHFAKGAVSILNSLKCVDALCFGMECDNALNLDICAEYLSKLSIQEIKSYQKQFPNLSFAQARERLCEYNLGKDISCLLSSPNNILAIEYLKAIKHIGANFEVFPVTRTAARHDGSIIEDNICSSSHLRSLLADDRYSECKNFVPDLAVKQLEGYKCVDMKLFFNFLSGSVLSKEPEELSEIAEIGGGFEYAIYKELLVSTDYHSLVNSLKSRHLTDAKIRRALLFASLGVKKNCFNFSPTFTEVLASNDRGKKILATIRSNNDIAVLSKMGNIKTASETAKNQFKLQREAELIFDKIIL